MTKLDLVLALIAVTRHVISLNWLSWGSILQVAAGSFALYGQWQMGNKRRWAPAVGLTGQGVWFAMIVANGVWGLLISNIPMAWVHYRNLRKWRRT